ncbi:ParD-like family protein [Gilvimarinus xylanilyticus]|uniref:ParD-like family protein n=1 Tax=Gilvimarinus xylanilyticus TaxID=2944139 RepID=A0A9X2KVG7_9GAMM|nr:ParD-like family protein [Gilvimarinus xylanilyticus]MCP8898035.1 ParD-like family protein [Gilvimarinus xylanilyticus]
MGIVKISDELHDELRLTSQVMERSINAQAEFWLKIGRLAELNQQLSFADVIQKAVNEARTHE